MYNINLLQMICIFTICAFLMTKMTDVRRCKKFFDDNSGSWIWQNNVNRYANCIHSSESCMALYFCMIYSNCELPLFTHIVHGTLNCSLQQNLKQYFKEHTYIYILIAHSVRFVALYKILWTRTNFIEC